MRSRTARSAALVASAALLAGGMLAATVPAATAAPAKYSHAAAAQQLKRAGINWTSSGGCSNRNNPKCTSFEQINKSTVAGVIDFKKASKCAVTITGGTENGHASGTYSHWNGYKLDISLSTCVVDYVTRHYTYVGYLAGFGYQYRAPSGNRYTQEGDHWDIVYYTCGC